MCSSGKAGQVNEWKALLLFWLKKQTNKKHSQIVLSQDGGMAERAARWGHLKLIHTWWTPGSSVPCRRYFIIFIFYFLFFI